MFMHFQTEIWVIIASFVPLLIVPKSQRNQQGPAGRSLRPKKDRKRGWSWQRAAREFVASQAESVVKADFNTVFSERELTLTFALCYRRSVCRLSVVCNVPAPWVTSFGGNVPPITPQRGVNRHFQAKLLDTSIILKLTSRPRFERFRWNLA